MGSVASPSRNVDLDRCIMISCKVLLSAKRISLRAVCVFLVVSSAVIPVHHFIRTGFGESALERLCGCRREFIPLFSRWISEGSSSSSTSWCSNESLRRGARQKVIAYSVYGNLTNELTRRRYFSLLPVNAEKIARSYPGWVVRLHHRINDTDPLGTALLCEIYCSFHHVDLCNVTESSQDPFLLKDTRSSVNLSYVDRFNPAMWRFLPLFDPRVDQFMARDADSRIIDREVAAVDQWIRSNHTFHIMRDHPLHSAKILAGMWGAKVSQRRQEIVRIAEQMLYEAQDDHYGTDQKLLDQFLWPLAKYDVMAHDSYRCNQADLNQVAAYPFPTKRQEDNDFVGDVLVNSFQQLIKPCPPPCRPQDHQDWEFC